jgi:hypothetical protein
MEDDEERYEPTEAFAALVEFDGNAELILDERLKVLPVDVESERQRVVVPHATNISCKASTSRLQRTLAFGELTFMRGKCGLVSLLLLNIAVIIDALLRSVRVHVRQLASCESEELQ